MTVLVCYRREDTIEAAGRLYDRLVAQFSREAVFKDVDTLPAGASFAEHIQGVIRQSDAVLVLIGPLWLKRPSPLKPPRVFQPGDFVRLEVETSLAAGVRVIPILVGKGKMPEAHQLPESLRGLCERHALPLRPDPDFGGDANRIIRELETPLPAVSKAPAAVPLPTPSPRSQTPVVAAVAMVLVAALFGAWWLNRGPTSPAAPTASQGNSPAKAAKESGSAVAPPTISNSLGMKLAFAPAGEFTMGAPGHEENYEFGQNQHRVRISQPFYMGVHEVTQGQYMELMGTNPSEFRDAPGENTGSFPVEQVSWDDAVEFCKRLSEKEHAEYGLPTEAQWEYACRAGTKGPYSFGDECDGTQANVDGRYPYHTQQPGPLLDRTTAVGSYAANPFGLYDMHGNVLEWCADDYNSGVYAGEGEVTVDPLFKKPEPDKYRACRGGCWYLQAYRARSAQRNGKSASEGDSQVGFRVVRKP